jgi:hypothetical protein
MDEFTKGYVEAALWSSLNSDDQPSRYYKPENIDNLAEMIEDCRRFQEQNAEWIVPQNSLINNYEFRAGFDFWMARNGLGVGFHDDPTWKEVARIALSKSAKEFDKTCFYINGVYFD